MSLAAKVGIVAIIAAPIGVFDYKFGDKAYGFSVLGSLFNPCANTNYSTVDMDSSYGELVVASHCGKNGFGFGQGAISASESLMNRSFD